MPGCLAARQMLAPGRSESLLQPIWEQQEGRARFVLLLCCRLLCFHWLHLASGLPNRPNLVLLTWAVVVLWAALRACHVSIYHGGRHVARQQHCRAQHQSAQQQTQVTGSGESIWSCWGSVLEMSHLPCR